MKKKKIWINNCLEQKMIYIDEVIPIGWTAGRLPVSEETKNKLSENKKNRIHVHLDNISKVIFKEDLDIYLEQGYELGRAKFSEEAIENIRCARKEFFSENLNWTNQTSWKLGQKAWNKGISMSKETKQKLSDSRTGLHLSNESLQLKIMHEKDTRQANAGSVKNSYKQAQEKRLETVTKLKNEDPLYNEKIQEKTKQTCLEKYGVENPMQLDEIKNKGFETKIKRNNFCSSKREDIFYNLLLSKFKQNDIFRQYKEERYPFHCDFYIKSCDLFIELNLYWTHGSKPFDINDSNDLKRLNRIKNNQKMITLKSGKVVKNQYYQAETVWTITDPNKLRAAKQNNLNYVTIYKESEMYAFISRI